MNTNKTGAGTAETKACGASGTTTPCCAQSNTSGPASASAFTRLATDLAWDRASGLLPAIVQDDRSGAVLMLAWMDRAAFEATCTTGCAHFYSRSRRRMWMKGESSGHVQHVKAILTDCDADTILLKVEQAGGIACHTGRASCFYRQITPEGWTCIAPVLKDPGEIYAAQAPAQEVKS